MPGPTEVQQARRDSGPVTERGVQRKAAILLAARRVFERKGFIDTRVSDIATEARVSHGTFYTYFDTKEAIFGAVAQSVVDEMVAAMTISMPTTVDAGAFAERVNDSVRRFVRAYRPHATMIGLIEQVGTFSPELRALRLDLRETFLRRTRRGIARMKAAGLTEPDLDVAYTAEVLGGMLEFTCYIWFSLGRRFDEDRIIDTLATVWRKTLSRDD